MTRFLNDQAKLVFLWESGTYSVASGNAQWPGMLQSHDITENLNINQIRFLGQGNRNVGIFTEGPIEVEGKLSLYPQDWRFLALALGSQTRTSGTAQTNNYKYDIAEVNNNTRANAYTSGTLNPFWSFTIEESRTGAIANKNSLRTIKGCVVNDFSLKISNKEPIVLEIGFIGQSGSWFSGTSSTVTAGSNRPYLWSDTSFSIAGVALEPVNNLTFDLKNNFERPFYLNGSLFMATPYALNRDYSVKVSQDMDSTTIGSLYDTYFKGGSTFNALLDINNIVSTGSRRVQITFSGCRITDVSEPVEVGGISKMEYSFVPGSVSAVAFDRLEFYSPF